MPQHLLEGENASTTSEEHHGKGVTDRMRGTAGRLDLGNVAQSLDELTESIASEGTAFLGLEERIISTYSHFPDVLPEDAPGLSTEVNSPVLVALPKDDCFTTDNVNVVELKPA